MKRVLALMRVYNITTDNEFDDTDEYADDSIYEEFSDVSPNVREMFGSCKWRQKYNPCVSHFTPSFTELGICYSFNGLNSHKMYTDEYDNSTLPRRIFCTKCFFHLEWLVN